MLYHIIAFLAGVMLDWIIGDPVSMLHPIRWIGGLIGKLTDKLLSEFLNGKRVPAKEKKRGLLLVVIVVLVTVCATSVLTFGAYFINPCLGVLIEAILTCYILAAKSLYVESMKVSKALADEGLGAGRRTVAMIVGRDTDCLDENGVIKAAVETVAENTSDGVIAPLLYTFIGGPVLGFAYKAVNTMDSMVGYHNDKYEHFGFYAAKLDDVVNYIPSRISAVFMILAACVSGKQYSGRDAVRIYKRDRYNHKSPNSAQTESVCAGAMRIRLAGDASYFGKVVSKPYIGDDIRDIEREDIRRAGLLMFVTEIVVIMTLVSLYIAVELIMKVI